MYVSQTDLFFVCYSLPERLQRNKRQTLIFLLQLNYSVTCISQANLFYLFFLSVIVFESKLEKKIIERIETASNTPLAAQSFLHPHSLDSTIFAVYFLFSYFLSESPQRGLSERRGASGHRHARDWRRNCDIFLRPRPRTPTLPSELLFSCRR